MIIVKTKNGPYIFVDTLDDFQGMVEASIEQCGHAVDVWCETTIDDELESMKELKNDGDDVDDEIEQLMLLKADGATDIIKKNSGTDFIDTNEYLDERFTTDEDKLIAYASYYINVDNDDVFTLNNDISDVYYFPKQVLSVLAESEQFRDNFEMNVDDPVNAFVKLLDDYYEYDADPTLVKKSIHQMNGVIDLLPDYKDEKKYEIEKYLLDDDDKSTEKLDDIIDKIKEKTVL